MMGLRQVAKHGKDTSEAQVRIIEKLQQVVTWAQGISARTYHMEMRMMRSDLEG